MARASRFAGRTVTFGLDRPADVSATHIESRGVRGMAADVATAAVASASRRRWSAAATSPTCSPALAVGLEAGVPLDAIAARAATLTPAVASRRSARLARRRHVIDDAYNANPARGRARARTCSAPSRRRATRRGARRDARARRPTPTRCTPRAGAAAAAPASTCWSRSAATRPRALAAARSDAGIAGGAVRHVATSDEAAEVVAGLRPARRSRAGEGLARHAHGSRRRSARGGGALMLYHLFSAPLHAVARRAERDPLHHVPHRGREPDGAADQPGARAVADPAGCASSRSAR